MSDTRIWMIGQHYGIHIYATGQIIGYDDPVATALTHEFAEQIVADHNVSLNQPDTTRIGIEMVLADVEKFIKRHRDEYSENVQPISWTTLDDLLDAFRMHVATGTPLDQELEV